MKLNKSLLALFAIFAILFIPITAFATIHNITIGNNFFSPTGTIVNPGDTVRWTWAGGFLIQLPPMALPPKPGTLEYQVLAGTLLILYFQLQTAPALSPTIAPSILLQCLIPYLWQRPAPPSFLALSLGGRATAVRMIL